MPTRDDWGDAIKEAYASAPSEEVIYHTIELRHDSFVDPLRFVLGQESITSVLENTAPQNPGEWVKFEPMSFGFSLPEMKDRVQPVLNLTIDNVSQEIVIVLEEAIKDPTPISITYRPFVGSDLSRPMMDPPISMVLSQVSVTDTTAEGRATFEDVLGKKVPAYKYTRDKFPYLFNKS